MTHDFVVGGREGVGGFVLVLLSVCINRFSASLIIRSAVYYCGVHLPPQEVLAAVPPVSHQPDAELSQEPQPVPQDHQQEKHPD